MGDAPAPPTRPTLVGQLTRRDRAVLRAAFVVLLGTILTAAIATVSGAGGKTIAELMRTWAPSIAYVLAAAIVVLRALRIEHARRAWMLIAAGLTLYGAGNLVWVTWLEHVAAPPIPSICDGLWLALYPASYVGVVLLARRGGARAPAGVWLDGIVAGLGIAALGAAIVVGPVFRAATGSTVAVATNLAYPVADLLLAALVMGVLALRGWRVDRGWAMLGGGFLVLCVADVLYLLNVAGGATDSALVPNLFYTSGVALLALAAWQPQRDVAPARLEGWSMLLVPSAFVLVAVALLLYDHFTRLHPLALALATLTLLTALVRTALTFRDVRALAETRREAATDDLTSLPNRRLFMRRLDQAIARAVTSGDSLALLIIGLDQFKKLNDTLGHDAGDQLLRQIGPRVAGALRATDTFARLGGDEFGVLLAGSSDEDAARRVAGRISDVLRGAFEVDGLHLHATASVGIALYPSHAESGPRLLQHADVALSQAKSSRGGCEVYARDRDTHSRANLALASELPGAIAAGELEVHFQPKALAGSRHVVGMEALVRWRHPERGLLSPAVFVALAEQAGLMRELTRAVMDAALAGWRAWSEAGHDLHVAVNVSVADLLDARFPHEVATALAAHGTDPGALVLEVTESSIMSDRERIGDVLARLGELGVRLALDDFGTGYSSLVHLKTLPVSEVKIDRSFVSRMGSDAADNAIVRSTITLAHNLGMRVVAEGVEDEQTWASLAELGCELIQGYCLARPLAPDDVEAFLGARAPASADARLELGALEP